MQNRDPRSGGAVLRASPLFDREETVGHSIRLAMALASTIAWPYRAAACRCLRRTLHDYFAEKFFNLFRVRTIQLHRMELADGRLENDVRPMLVSLGLLR